MTPDEGNCLLTTQAALLAADHKSDVLRKKLLAPALRRTARVIRIRKQCNVYTCGDENEMIYLIQSGHVKLVVDSSEGKECLLDIYSSGDFFGESCLTGLKYRVETATAMADSVLHRINRQQFIAALSDAEMHILIQCLNIRILEQQLFITDMATTSSEFRLGKVLLRLGLRLGKKHLSGTVIGCRISQEELSQMVGTTRPRVTKFINKFRELDLINLSIERLIVVKEANLMNYLSKLV
ncbi:MAG TPA: Crp/Fnr family transcriptional regulator [Pyrinomonadaceae bacterium]|jgi:CRP-like cAMP-binding protein